MGIQVKICGITSAEAADAAVRAGADFAGLNLHPTSPRNLAPRRSAHSPSACADACGWPLCSAMPTDEAIAQAVAAVKPDFIQLHGNEPRERVAEIRGALRYRGDQGRCRSPRPPISPNVPAYEAVADMLMFDARPPQGAARSGGHGSAFDWQLLRGRKFVRPWFLAGGLNPENVARAVATSGAEIVDVSSGVETAPGVKERRR